MNNTSVDKFAEYRYYSCETQHNDNNNCSFGRGRFRAGYSNGCGILENNYGAGFAKGYTNKSNLCPAHYISHKY